MQSWQMFCGDSVEVLATLPDNSVHCVVTSPPYCGLRDYGVEGQIGLEATPELYVERMVAVFREVRRVLRSDGTCWLNIGDSYAAKPAGVNGYNDGRAKREERTSGGVPVELKPKDLIGIPWRVAFALHADGWYLRQDIIWHKPNPMPESVRDRCTKAHEYIFLLSKSERYYFDSDAIAEPTVCDRKPGQKVNTTEHYGVNNGGNSGLTGLLRRYHNGEAPTHRNKRSVWTVPTSPYSGAHFATFPPDLIRPMIRAGCPFGGVVLDPFAGSGTTGVVALEEGRQFLGLELNPSYVEMARKRIGGVMPLLAQERVPDDTEQQAVMF